MGFQHASLLVPTSFFLGVLFICFTVDYRILWGEQTEEVIKDGFQFYTTFFSAPPAIKALLHGMMGVGLLGGVYKLNKWDESAMFFDGSSLAAYVFAIVVYLAVVVPGLRAVADPVKNVDTMADRIEALRVASAGNIIMIGCFTLVLVLQAGQEYARRVDAKALAQAQQKSAVEATAKKEKKQ